MQHAFIQISYLASFSSKRALVSHETCLVRKRSWLQCTIPTPRQSTSPITSSMCFTLASSFIDSKGKSGGFTTVGGDSTTLDFFRLRRYNALLALRACSREFFWAIHHSYFTIYYFLADPCLPLIATAAHQGTHLRTMRRLSPKTIFATIRGYLEGLSQKRSRQILFKAPKTFWQAPQTKRSGMWGYLRRHQKKT